MRALALALVLLALTANVAAADEGGSGTDVLPYDPGLPQSPYDPGFPEAPYDPGLDVPYDPGLPAVSTVAVSPYLLNT